MAERMFHPECTTYDWTDDRTLSLVDYARGTNVGQVKVSGTEWSELEAAGVDHLFSGQVPEVSWGEADRQVRSAIGRGFDRC